MNVKNFRRSISLVITSIFAAFFFLFNSVVFIGCTSEDFEERAKTPDQPVIKGDTLLTFDAKTVLRHGEWETANGLISVQNVLDGYINYSVRKNGETTPLKAEPIQQSLPMNFKWTALEETTGAAQMTYLGQETVTGKTETSKNGNITLTTISKVTTLKFAEGNVEIAASYDVASLGSDKAPYCQFDSMAVVAQKTDTLPEIIKKEGEDYKRAKTVATVRYYLTDMPENKKHTEDHSLEYSKLFRVNLAPGEKVYQGKTKIEGSEKYYKLPNGNFHSEVSYELIYTQDGKTIKETEVFAGEAKITWNLPKDNAYPVKSIEIGNPSMKASYDDAKEPIKKSENVEAIVRSYTFPFVWENGYTKTASATVERLRGVMNGDTFEMPTAESSMSFSKYVSGTPTEGEEYTIYNDGILYFVGTHSTENYNLEKGQVFQIKVDKVFIGNRFVQEFDETTGKSVIKAYEIWKDEPEKLVATYETTMAQRAYGDDAVRFFGSSLSFISGLSKTVNEPKASDYKAEGNNVFAASIKTILSARLNLGTTNFYHERTKKYVMYGEKQVFFKGFDEPTVGSFSDSNITLTNTNDNFVEGDDTYTRRSYNATLAINNENITNIVNVDELQAKDPTVDPEFGYLDWEKTKQFGGLSWAWDVVDGKLTPVLNVTVITTAGTLNNVAGSNNFLKMDVNTITNRLGAGLNVGTGNKWIPSTIEVKEGSTGNPYWFYMGVDGKSTTSVNGVDVLKIEGVDLHKPFFDVPTEGSTTFSNKNGHVVVTYKGEVVFDEIFPVK